jgi:ribosomal protein S21
LATVQVFNGNLEQALLSLRKQLQRDQLISRIRNGLFFVSKAGKKARKKQEAKRRHVRKRRMVANAS